VLLALTTERMLGLGVVAGLFIVFAALSAFYFPRRNPDFPGNRLGLFVVVTMLFFVGTMAAVVVFAKEEEGHGAEAAATEHAETETTTEEEGGSQEVPGDAAAGEAVFASAGCGGCHVLAAANASGAVGPNLDESKPPVELVVERVRDGSGLMPSFEGQLSDKQIADVAAYVVASTQG
jgi:mono/diheme cytochrome c family protein